MRDLVRQEANFLKELSEGKRVVDIHDYYEKGEHSLLVLEYLGVSLMARQEPLYRLSLSTDTYFKKWRPAATT